MIILSIDSSTDVATAAIANDEKIIAEFTLNNKKTHSQTLMPLIENMFSLAQMDIKDIDYIACTNGPGSFTGLRIGVCIAKGLAHGLNKPIVEVPTLDALAYNVFEYNNLIVPLIDARHNRAYYSFYKRNGNNLERLCDYSTDEVENIYKKALELDNSPIFLGDGVKYLEKGSKAQINNQNLRAGSVIIKARELINEGRVLTYNDITINYLKKSQAEIELEEKNKNA